MKIRGDEPVGVIIHRYMEISQGNTLCSTFISNKQKCHAFFFLSFIFLLQNWRLGGQNRSWPERGGGWHQWERGGGERV
jgi:hypothetical protein